MHPILPKQSGGLWVQIIQKKLRFITKKKLDIVYQN